MSNENVKTKSVNAVKPDEGWMLNLDEELLRSELVKNGYGNYDATGRNPAVVIIDGKWRRRCEKLGIRHLPAFHGFNKVRSFYHPIIRGLAISVLDAHLIPNNNKLESEETFRYMNKSIGEALYVINKAAKRRRDAASSAYENGCYGIATKHKEEKEEYYRLKEEVLKKAIERGIAKYKGLHSKNGTHHNKERVYHEDGCDCFYCERYLCGNRDEPGWDIEDTEEEVKEYYDCYEIDGYSFHKPAKPPKENVECKDLGGWISAAKPYKGSFPIKYAIARLEKFLEEDSEVVEKVS